MLHKEKIVSLILNFSLFVLPSFTVCPLLFCKREGYKSWLTLKELMNIWESSLCAFIFLWISAQFHVVGLFSEFSHLGPSKISSYISCDSFVSTTCPCECDALATRYDHEWITSMLMRTKSLTMRRRRTFQGTGAESSDKIWLHCICSLCMFKRGKILAF